MSSNGQNEFYDVRADFGGSDPMAALNSNQARNFDIPDYVNIHRKGRRKGSHSTTYDLPSQ